MSPSSPNTGPEQAQIRPHDGRHWRRWLLAVLVAFPLAVTGIVALETENAQIVEGMEPVAGQIERVQTGARGSRMVASYVDGDGQTREVVVWAPERVAVPPAGTDVTLLVDPERPDRAVVDGVEWQRRGPALVMASAVAVALTAAGGLVVSASRRVRYRWQARRAA